MGYLAFVLDNRRFVAFGLLLTASSSFGQTYFIALFGGEIRAAFELTHGGFGAVYALATLTSALCLVWLGRLIDRFDLRPYTLAVCAGLAAACFTMAAASSLALLYLALVALRLSGQGLMTHVGVTTMARYFQAVRGRAVSLVSLGHAAGQAIVPPAGVALIAALGWREAWLAGGAFVIAAVVPLVLWSLKGHAARHRRHVERLRAGAAAGAAAAGTAVWSRREVVRDTHFYLALPAALAPAFILTGVFFHQVHLVAAKGWSLALFAGAFPAFAAAGVAGALGAGGLVDRFGARRLLAYYLLPLAAALVVLAAFDAPFVVACFMVAAGLSSGASFTLAGALWAEVYGIAHIGAIRALVTALMVVATALAPVAMGALIDAGVAMAHIMLACAVYALAATTLAARAFRPRAAARTPECP